MSNHLTTAQFLYWTITQSLRICNYCNDNGITVVSILPHTSRLYSRFILRLKDPWKLLSTGSLICTRKEVHMKKLRSMSWLSCWTKPFWRSIEWGGKNPASELQKLFEANVETNKMTNKESEEDNHATTSVATRNQHTKCGTTRTTTWFVQNVKCDRRFATTISGYSRYRLKCQKAKFGKTKMINNQRYC